MRIGSGGEGSAGAATAERAGGAIGGAQRPAAAGGPGNAGGGEHFAVRAAPGYSSWGVATGSKRVPAGGASAFSLSLTRTAAAAAAASSSSSAVPWVNPACAALEATAGAAAFADGSSRPQVPIAAARAPLVPARSTTPACMPAGGRCRWAAAEGSGAEGGLSPSSADACPRSLLPSATLPLAAGALCCRTPAATLRRLRGLARASSPGRGALGSVLPGAACGREGSRADERSRLLPCSAPRP